MTTVAVTGCSSRFARVLLPLLVADPQIDRIIGIDLVPPSNADKKLTFIQQDIRAASLAETLRGCDTVIHLAFVVGRPYALPLHEAASINLEGTWNTCKAAAVAGARKLVVSSSIAAYGVVPGMPVPLLEDSPLRGLYNNFYYSQHKHANEIWLDGFQREYPTLLISRLRPCIVMGPHQIVADGINPAEPHYTTAEARRGLVQFIHEDDLAAAFHLMVQRDLPGAYNVVGDDPASWPQLATVAGLTVVEVPARDLQAQTIASWKEGRTPFGPEWIAGESAIICSNAKLKATGAWTPRYTTSEAYVATIDALRRQTDE